MRAVLIFGVLALLSCSLAVPVIDQVKDEELTNDLFHEDTKNSPRRPLLGNGQRGKGLLNRLTKTYRIWKYLKSYGYIPKGMRSASREKQRQLGMWKFAVWNGAKIGKKMFMSKAMPIFERGLASISQQPRCGDPDIGKGRFRPKEQRKDKRTKRYLAQTPWGKNTLTYKIESFDSDLPVEVQRQEIAKAFKLWTDASELTVSEVQGSTTADINIQFVAGSHSDSAPFDGPGFVVAHAFYPEDGRIHFDSDEQFTTGGEANKVNLLSIATHEIGHALGLGHSTHSNAIMHAQYQGYSPNLALSQDDIDGITYLYPLNSAGGCVDEFWCEDILQDECLFFEEYCKKKCGAC